VSKRDMEHTPIYGNGRYRTTLGRYVAVMEVSSRDMEHSLTCDSDQHRTSQGILQTFAIGPLEMYRIHNWRSWSSGNDPRRTSQGNLMTQMAHLKMAHLKMAHLKTWLEKEGRIRMARTVAADRGQFQSRTNQGTQMKNLQRHMELAETAEGRNHTQYILVCCIARCRTSHGNLVCPPCLPLAEV